MCAQFYTQFFKYFHKIIYHNTAVSLTVFKIQPRALQIDRSGDETLLLTRIVLHSVSALLQRIFLILFFVL